jgi:acetoin utilization deacetylase AcuC-like enzyme
MSTRLYEHPIFLEHVTPPGHPERADRLRSLNIALEHPNFARLDRKQAPQANEDAVLLAHPEEHLTFVMRSIPDGDGEDDQINQLEADTYASPKSLQAALTAIGGATAAVDDVFSGAADNVFVAARPPGHHAEKNKAMGFCFFNNAAVAAEQLRRRHGASRVAVFDFDVHHGNGTQHLFEERADVFYASTHQYPFYPGTGAADERGIGAGEGFTLNVPLPAGTGDERYGEALRGQVLPALRRFAPDVLVLSAGFDAWRSDPLGGMRVTAEGFRAWGDWLRALAAEVCGGRVLAVLEGGYDLGSLPRLVEAHLEGLAGGRP